MLSQLESHIRPLLPGGSPDTPVRAGDNAATGGSTGHRLLSGALALLGRQLAELKHRRAVRKTVQALNGLDDRTLADIGIPRDTIANVVVAKAQSGTRERANLVA